MQRGRDRHHGALPTRRLAADTIIDSLREMVRAVAEAPGLDEAARAFEVGALDTVFRIIRVDEVMQLDGPLGAHPKTHVP